MNIGSGESLSDSGSGQIVRFAEHGAAGCLTFCEIKLEALSARSCSGSINIVLLPRRIRLDDDALARDLLEFFDQRGLGCLEGLRDFGLTQRLAESL